MSCVPCGRDPFGAEFRTPIKPTLTEGLTTWSERAAASVDLARLRRARSRQLGWPSGTVRIGPRAEHSDGRHEIDHREGHFDGEESEARHDSGGRQYRLRLEAEQDRLYSQMLEGLAAGPVAPRASCRTAGAGVDASNLGTVGAAHGALQVTYSGRRLYWFAKDKAHGQVHGNVKDKWGKWSTVVTA